MNEADKQLFFEKYEKRTHLLGRIAELICIILFVGAPFAMGWYLNTTPDIKACVKGFFAAGIIFALSAIPEFMLYVPMIGSGGSYVAFITGNLINMKIPCAMNAKDIVGTKSGTDENEIVSTLSVATSSLVTIVVIAAGVLLLTPLRPVLENPVLTPAFENVVPALFGALAYKYFKGNMKIAAIPLVTMALLFVFVPSLISNVSTMVIPSGFFAILVAYLIYRKS